MDDNSHYLLDAITWEYAILHQSVLFTNYKTNVSNRTPK